MKKEVLFSEETPEKKNKKASPEIPSKKLTPEEKKEKKNKRDKKEKQNRKQEKKSIWDLYRERGLLAPHFDRVMYAESTDVKVGKTLKNLNIPFEQVSFYEENPETGETFVSLEMTEKDLKAGKPEEVVVIHKDGSTEKVVLDDTARIAYDSVNSDEGENMLYEGEDDREYYV
jgi:hypothetical protein